MRKGIESHDFGGSFYYDQCGKKQYHYQKEDYLTGLVHLNLLWSELGQVNKKLQQAREKNQEEEIQSLTIKQQQLIEKIKNQYGAQVKQ